MMRQFKPGWMIGVAAGTRPGTATGDNTPSRAAAGLPWEVRQKTATEQPPETTSVVLLLDDMAAAAMRGLAAIVAPYASDPILDSDPLHLTLGVWHSAKIDRADLEQHVQRIALAREPVSVSLDGLEPVFKKAAQQATRHAGKAEGTVDLILHPSRNDAFYAVQKDVVQDRPAIAVYHHPENFLGSITLTRGIPLSLIGVVMEKLSSPWSEIKSKGGIKVISNTMAILDFEPKMFHPKAAYKSFSLSTAKP